MHAPWGFVGRAAELAHLIASATDVTTGGLVFGGVAGIGKTRLLREGVAALDRDRFAVLTATATAATTSLPFGGLAQVLPVDQPAGLSPAGLLRWAVDALREQAWQRPIVLAIDDVHLLDPISAALVSYVVQSGQATLVATVRNGEPTPDPIRALWTEDVVERVDLGPLGEADTANLLADVLGGEADLASVRRLWQLSEGNVLLLRELVLAARGAGELNEEHGLWRWTGRLELAPSLTEVIDARIGALPPDVRTVVEYVAFGEPIGLRLLANAGVGAAVELAEERQLLTVIADGRRATVRLAHPLYGEVARQRCPVTRAHRVLATLATLVEGTGARRSNDLLRVATWRLDSGTAHSAGLLLKACQQAFASYDIPLALRLGRAAFDAGGSFDAAETLATLLMFADRSADAIGILDSAAAQITRDEQRARWHAVRGITTYWGLGDESAPERMVAAAAALPCEVDRMRVHAIEAMMRVHHNEPARLAEVTEAVLACPVARPGDRVLAVSAAAHMRAARGQPVRTVCEMAAVEADSGQWRGEVPYVQLAVEAARGTAMILAVDLAAVDAVIAAEYAGMVDEGDFHLGSGYLTIVRAQAERLRGRLGDAARYARLARARLIDGRIFAGLACAEVAHAAALSGKSDTAAAAMAEADQVQRSTMAILYPELEFARAWTCASAGDTPGAVRTLHRLLDRLRADGFSAYEVVALHDLVRLGDPAAAVEPLEKLATTVEGPFAPAAARHARAAAGADLPGLLASAAEFAALGLYLYAAESATNAVKTRQGRRSGRGAEAAARRAEYLAVCHNIDDRRLAVPQPTLSEREQQIARRAAAGVTSKQIAAELFLSRRTVDNHLLRIYSKLGVNGRPDLPAALRTAGSRTQ
jgi:DNA-binding CsgD family transcriptional regulator